MISQTGQQTYCPISQEVKTTRQWNFVSSWNITWKSFFLKNLTQNVAEKLVPDPFLKKSKLSISLA